MTATTFRPTAGRGMPRRTNGRSTGRNPFLEGFVLEDGSVSMEGTLQDSWELKLNNEKSDFEVTVPGKLEKGTISKGPNVGKPTERLTGEANTVENQLRAAADKLGIGVSVVISEAVTDKGKPRPGWYTVQYDAKKRANYGPRTSADTEAEEDAEDTEA